jgi:Ca-activated chloride channel family protein
MISLGLGAEPILEQREDMGMNLHSQCLITPTIAKVSFTLFICLGWISHPLLAADDDSGSKQVTQSVEMVPAAATEIRLRPGNIHTRPIQVEVQMVMVGVTVTDPDGRIVTGLTKNDFRVYDDKVPQQIASFSAEDAPASVGILFDSSASMANKIDRSRAAALEFFKTSNPDDEFMLIDFSNRPNLLSAFTSKVDALEDGLLLLEAGGRTAMLDGIYLGLSEMRRAHSSRKALVVVSDGIDNQSRYTEREITAALRESDTELYAIGILETAAFRWLPGEKSGPALLSRLANLSGGHMFPAKSAAELPEIARKISLELRNQYVIGYRPSNLIHDGRWRHINLELAASKSGPSLRVSNRAGYYAPTQ